MPPQSVPPGGRGCIPRRYSTALIRRRRCRRHRSCRDRNPRRCRCRCRGRRRRRSCRRTCRRRTRRFRWEEVRHTPSAASAVGDVGGEIGAMTAATGLPQGVAVISAGPAVRVVQQVAAHPAASGGRAADVSSARSADAAGVAVARPAGRQALRLLLRRATFAESFARVLRPAQAVPTPSGLSTAPARTAPSRRSDSRRGTDSASDLENSSNRLSMIDPSLSSRKVIVTVASVSISAILAKAFADTKRAGGLLRAYDAARAAIVAVPIQVGAVAVRFRAYPVGTVRR